MSSVISTKGADAKAGFSSVGADRTTGSRGGSSKTGNTQVGTDMASDQSPLSGATRAAGLLPWQFFVLAALGCATAVNVMVRGQGITTVVLVTMLIGSTALVGIAALRTLNPLVTEEDDRTAVVGGRTRAALEREKVLALRAIKELEFDRAMGKVSDSDFEEMAGRLRARAVRLMRQLDAGASYHDQIERDLEKRLGDRIATESSAKASVERDRSAKTSAERICACGTANDHDARFCKSCGARL